MSFRIRFEVQGEPPNSSADSHGCNDFIAYLLDRLGCVDVFWYFYVGHLQSSADVIALRFVRHLVGGMIIAVLADIIHSKSAKTVLIAAAVLFIAFVVLPIILFEQRHVAPTPLLFCLIGLPIGMSIPAAIFRPA